MSPSGLATWSALELRVKESLRSISPVQLPYFVARTMRVRAERRMLLSLDDRMLKDVGLSRGQAYAEASRSVFDLPHRTCW